MEEALRELKTSSSLLEMVWAHNRSPCSITSKYSKLGVTNLQNFSFKKLTDLGDLGISTTEPEGHIAVDSACSATQLSTGFSSTIEVVGLDHNLKERESILEKAKKKGLSTGVVSDTTATHATPASFYAHHYTRHDAPRIAEDFLKTMPDILMSGGAKYFYPKGHTKKIYDGFTIKSKRTDHKNLIQSAKNHGYKVLHTKSDLIKTKEKKILGLFSNAYMPDGIWYSKNLTNPKRKIPSLLEMTQKSVEILSQNKKGYFLMVEAGQIDWAGHRNDAGLLLHEMLRANRTINWLIEHVQKNPDTLLIVTADHETGGFAFGPNAYNPPKAKIINGKIHHPHGNYVPGHIVDSIYKQNKSLESILNEYKRSSKKQIPKLMQKLVSKHTGFKITTAEAKKILEKSPNPYFNGRLDPHIEDFRSFYYDPKLASIAKISRVISKHQGISWSTGGHTATPVYVFTLGNKKFLKEFSKFTNHVELGKNMQKVLGLWPTFKK